MKIIQGGPESSRYWYDHKCCKFFALFLGGDDVATDDVGTVKAKTQ